MKYWPGICLVICLQFSAVCLFAQGKDGCEKHYFSNGRISTTQCYVNSNFGKAIAYDINGKVIYEQEIRKVGGHSSVYFSYYDNGAVSKAEWSSAPDGGIQWYRSVTKFAIDGSVTGFTENSYDDCPRVFSPKQEPTIRPAIQNERVVMPEAVYSSDFWFVNDTRRQVVVHADRMFNSDEFHTVAIAPGDTAKVGALILAGQFDYPEKYYRFSANYRDNGKRKVFGVRLLATEQRSNTARRYYYRVR